MHLEKQLSIKSKKPSHKMSVKSEMFYILALFIMGRVRLQETVIKQLNQETSLGTISNKEPLVLEDIIYSTEGYVEKQPSLKYKPKFVKQNKHYPNIQDISKCCPFGFLLDDWYHCVENASVAQDVFVNKLLEVSANDKEKYVIVHTKKVTRLL